MESPNSLYNNINNTSKDGLENNENIVIPSNFLISTKEIIARFPHNKRVGHYLLGRKLGEGSFAKVKEGLHTLTGQKVAIKVIDKKKAKEDAYVSKNMRREGKLLQMIIHPNIIQLYELMETENSYYLVTELCEGGDLMDYICARKYLSEVCTRKFIRQIISAVDYLHRIGILHRDLKIENLLLDKNLNIKLIDFGLSNYTKSELCITQCGSPAYAAPELLAHKKYGSKVDVWSIGVNMYAMLTGNLPFTVEPFNIKSLYNKMMKNEMNAIPEHLSKSGEELLRKLLNPDPIKRISLKEAMEHPWLNEGYSNPLKPFPYPNKPTEDQVNPTILRYMNSNMEFNGTEVAENIKTNKPSSSLATYYLLLNKVKTMLLKMDPKKDKIKPRIDSNNTNNNTTNTTNNNNSNSNGKQTTTTVKDLKQLKQTPQSANNNHSIPQSAAAAATSGPVPSTQNGAVTTTITTTTTTTAAVIAAAAQSHNQRSVKTPGSTTITTTTAASTAVSAAAATVANGSNQNTFTLIRNKTDIINKYAIKPPDQIRTVSPIPMITNSVSNSVNNSVNNSAPINPLLNGYSNTISSANPAATFAGAIKNLTQKYKTMHLNSSTIDTTTNNNNNLNGSVNSSLNTNNNIVNTSLNISTLNQNNANNTTTTTNSNNFHFKTTYLSNGNSTNNGLLNNSIDIGINNTIHNNSNSSGDGTSSNNSESQSMSEERQHQANILKPTNNFSNRNSLSTTPILGKVTNSTNAEWTQMIRLNTVKTKSDLNNNDLINYNKEQEITNIPQTAAPPPPPSYPPSSSSSSSNNNNNHNNNHNNTTTHMPVISFPNSATSFIHSNNNSINGGGGASHFNNNTRLNKSPLMQKLPSPVTLPAIDNNNSSSISSNNGDRSSPQ